MIDATQIFDGTLGTSLDPPTGVAITVTRDSTNILNELAARDLGAGGILELHVVVTEAFATLTSLDIEFKGSSAVGGTYYTLLAELAIPVAQLIVGAPIFRYKWPLNQVFNATAGVLKAPPQFYKFVYTVNGSTATAGKVFTYVNAEEDRQQYTTYNNNYTTARVL